jgi:hypothetical protein
MPYQTFVVAGHENDEFSFQKLELPSQARTFWAMGPGPLGAVANGFRLIQQAGTTKVWFFFFAVFCVGITGAQFVLSQIEPPLPQYFGTSALSSRLTTSPASLTPD